MAESPQHPANGRIIFVDKDGSMRQLMEMALSDRFQLITARSAEEGLALVESEAPFDIVISDFTLSWMNGAEFLRQVGKTHPHTVRILMSGGCGDMVDIDYAIRKGHINRFVLKPFCLSTFLDQLMTDLASVITTGTANE